MPTGFLNAENDILLTSVRSTAHMASNNNIDLDNVVLPICKRQQYAVWSASTTLTWTIAPTMTRVLSMAGPTVVAAVEGSSVYSTTPAKNGMPAQSMKTGVAPATPRHPRRSNKTGDANMRVPVTRPVHMATSPMNACKHYQLMLDI